MFAPPKATKVNYDEIEKRLRHALVGNLEFHCTLDDRIFDLLLPFASKFRRATCRVPTRFDTTDTLLRAFLELFLRDTMVFQKFFVGGEVNQEVTFWTTSCSDLTATSPVGPSKPVGWSRTASQLPFPFTGSSTGCMAANGSTFTRSTPFKVPVSSSRVQGGSRRESQGSHKASKAKEGFEAGFSFASPRVPEDTSETFENETTGEILTTAVDSCDLDGFISDVRYTLTRRADVDEEEDEKKEAAMDEYWNFGEDNLVHLDAAMFDVHPWHK